MHFLCSKQFCVTLVLKLSRLKWSYAPTGAIYLSVGEGAVPDLFRLILRKLKVS